MAKALRNLALLGGLGAAAMMMGRKKGDEAGTSKEDKERDAREEAISGPLKDTKSTKATKAIGRSIMKGDKSAPAAAAPSVRKPPADSGSVRTPGREMPSASTLRSGAKSVVEANPGDFDRMMAERRKSRARDEDTDVNMGDVIGAKKGGMIKSSASKRAGGCAIKGKTRGRMI